MITILRSFKQVKILRKHRRWVEDILLVSFREEDDRNYSNKLLISCSEDGIILLYNVEKEKFECSFLNNQPLYSLEYIDSEKKLVATDLGSHILVFDIVHDSSDDSFIITKTRSIRVGDKGNYFDSLSSSCGMLFTSCSSGRNNKGELKVLNYGEFGFSGAAIRTIHNQKESIRVLCVSERDKNVLFIGGGDRKWDDGKDHSIKVYNILEKKVTKKRILRENMDQVTCILSYVPNHKDEILFVSNFSKELFVVKNEKTIHRLDLLMGVSCLSLFNSDNIVFGASEIGEMYLLSTSARDENRFEIRKLTTRYNKHKGTVKSIICSDRNRIYSCSNDATIRIFKVNNFDFEQDREDLNERCNFVIFEEKDGIFKNTEKMRLVFLDSINTNIFVFESFLYL